MSVNQEQNLVKLGCSHNLLDEFKRLNLVQNPVKYTRFFIRVFLSLQSTQ